MCQGAQDQGVQGGNLVISNVTAAQDGFIVIHRANAAGDGPLVPSSIGHAAVRAGDSTDVEVTLSESVGGGDQLFAMLHIDSNNNGVYEFGPGSTDLDTPASVDDGVVVEPFSVQGEGTTTAEGLIMRQSPKSIDETQAQLVAIEDNENLTLMTVIDHAANAESVGLELHFEEAQAG